MERWLILLFGVMTLSGLPMQAQAEPPIHLSPIVSGLLKSGLIVVGAVGKALDTLSPTCQGELEQCWDSHGMNKGNHEQVQDTCWHESKHCPEVCKDGYFKRRESGMSALQAEDNVLFGELSCASD